MPERELHIIRRQVLDLQLNSQKEALARQQQISRVYRERVLPALAEAFDRLELGKDTLHIRQLEIDLGEISPDHLESGFVEQCVQQIQKAVFYRYKELTAGLTSGNIRLTGEAESAMGSFLYFLETGRLRPFLRRYSWPELEKYWLGTVINAPSQKLLPQLAKINLYRNYPVTRLVEQFLPSFLEQVVLALAPSGAEFQKPLSSFLKVLDEAIVKGAVSASRGKSRYLKLIQILLAADGQQQKYRELVRQIHALEKTMDPGEGSGRSFPAEDPSPEAEPLEPLENMEEVMAGSGEWVDLAGLVILHPFLSALFQYLEFLEDGAFSDRRLQERAIFLLYFLATGKEDAIEHELLFPKIICGWPVKMPLSKSIELSKKEKAEAEELLTAAIKHWPALKNTSVEGLRQAFIQREGMINYEESAQRWLLKVESKGQDVLLEKLPWSFSLIQFPWLEAKIWVDW